MPIVLVNPLDEAPRPRAAPAARLDSIAGKTVALLDISKPGGNVFLDRIEQLLTERYGVAGVVRVTKPTFTKPAPESVIASFRESRVDAVIEALAD
jgi:hypothetical protein